MSNIFISPLSWGLGHTYRVTPIIDELINNGHRVTIATSGGALAMLNKEFPNCDFIRFPDYPAPYSSTRFFFTKFALNIPKLSVALSNEKKMVDKLFSEREYDLVISDNRLGVYSDDIPSLFISHQLRFSLPDTIRPLEALTLYINEHFHKKFDRVIIPDNHPGSLCLSGMLCMSTRAITNSKAYYAGILCPSVKLDVPEDLDYLICISGHEPQRSILEKILLQQVQKLPGKKIVLLGRPQDNTELRLDENTLVKSYVSDEEKNLLMNRAKFIICRSDFTTMMDIAELGKKHALFIPTPGHTKQEYLSEYYAQQGWFYSNSQYNLDLPEDVKLSMNYTGFPAMPKTKGNVRKLYDDVISDLLPPQESSRTSFS